MTKKSQRIRLVIGIPGVVLAIAVAWFFSLRSGASASTSLEPSEVRQILRTIAKKRWELVGFAIANRDFELLRHFVSARVESVDAEPGSANRASVRCSATLESGVAVVFELARKGTNDWAFERWLVIEHPRQKVSPPSVRAAQLDNTNTAK
jgi:hypothetical protein